MTHLDKKTTKNSGFTFLSKREGVPKLNSKWSSMFSRASTYADTDVFIMCFAVDNHSRWFKVALLCTITSLASYENIREKWQPEIRQHCPNTPRILVGLKKDLRENEETISRLEKSNRKPITYAQGWYQAIKSLFPFPTESLFIWCLF